MALSNFRRRNAAGAPPKVPRLDFDPSPVWPVPPVTPGPWLDLPRESAAVLIADLLAAGTDAAPAAIHGVRVQAPAFRRDILLIECLTARVAADGGGATLLFALGPEFVALFDGTAPVIHALNAEAPPGLEERDALDAYLQFFGHVVCGEAGAFQILETADDLPPHPPSPVLARLIEKCVEPLLLLARHDDGSQDVEAVVLYGGALFKVIFRISRGGGVDMLEDDPMASDLPIGAFHIVDRERRAIAPR
ncbi:hypothetical protein L2U69_18795 [Zavarzinia compransoris]|uniref:hypothetical protein n=1 Tax=Zavarzinia marina TaxID=2911065 RepID=UPI001F342385|nr:hypothetical protein [Zavarzinia marina]MCF4167701.1 hypothetical protein [Zavarzinia marina]